MSIIVHISSTHIRARQNFFEMIDQIETTMNNVDYKINHSGMVIKIADGTIYRFISINGNSDIGKLRGLQIDRIIVDDDAAIHNRHVLAQHLTDIFLCVNIRPH